MTSKIENPSVDAIDAGVRAIHRLERVKAWVVTVETWTSVAKDCMDAEDEKDYERLGYKSHSEWLSIAAPNKKSRSYLYLIAKQYRELKGLLPASDVDEVKLGCVSVLKQASPEVRRDPRVIAAAKDKPEKLREVLEQDFPQQHIETTINKRLKFPKSMWENTVKPCWEKFLESEPDAGFEAFIEFLCTEKKEE